MGDHFESLIVPTIANLIASDLNGRFQNILQIDHVALHSRTFEKVSSTCARSEQENKSTEKRFKSCVG